MCTGDYMASGNNSSANQRPPFGTKCVEPCVIESGVWGSSWCITSKDRSQWGAECIPCFDAKRKLVSVMISCLILDFVNICSHIFHNRYF